MKNVEVFKKLCKKNKELALSVCKAKAYAEVKREEVDAYILPIFQKYTFPVDPKFVRFEGEIVTKVEDLYLADLDSEDVYKFHEECDKVHREHGFTGPKGHCPALIAEHRLCEVENALLEVFQEFFGIKDIYVGGKDRKKMLDLVIGACLLKEEKS